MLFQWGRCGDDWVLLEPVETHDDLDKSYLDENGAPRADHRDRHDGVPAVNVTRLARKIRAEVVVNEDSVPLVEDGMETEGSGGLFSRFRK